MHRFVDFKGFKDAKLDLGQPLTLLIGRNGSGKTNAIEGVELLAHLAQGRALHEITDLDRGGVLEIRGGIQGCATERADVFTLEFSTEATDASPLVYSISIRSRPETRVVIERLSSRGAPIFEAQYDPVQGRLLGKAWQLGSEPPKPFSTPGDRSLLSSIDTLVPSAHASIVREVREHLRASFVFDPSTRAMRGYVAKGTLGLTRNGSSLSSVLFALKSGSPDDQAALTRIIERLRQLPEEPYDDYGFAETQLGDVQLVMREAATGRLIETRRLSDGTLRALAVLTALETVEPDARVILEEFDAGLHGSRVGMLLDAILAANRDRKLHLLCTTHNPATLDALSDEQLQGVVVAHRNAETHALELTPLMELPEVEPMLIQHRLGDVVTRGIVERHLAPGFSEEKHERALAWLKSLP